MRASDIERLIGGGINKAVPGRIGALQATNIRRQHAPLFSEDLGPTINARKHDATGNAGGDVKLSLQTGNFVHERNGGLGSGILHQICGNLALDGDAISEDDSRADVCAGCEVDIVEHDGDA